jgi:polyhydroxyalkanoate synthesis regulator phasin
MAKKQKRSDAVRSAVDEAFQVAAGQVAGQAMSTRDRASELVDALAGAAGRLRDVLDDLRPPSGDELNALRDEVRALRREVETLGERVARLEAQPKRSSTAKRRTTTKKS